MKLERDDIKLLKELYSNLTGFMEILGKVGKSRPCKEFMNGQYGFKIANIIEGMADLSLQALAPETSDATRGATYEKLVDGEMVPKVVNMIRDMALESTDTRGFYDATTVYLHGMVIKLEGICLVLTLIARRFAVKDYSNGIVVGNEVREWSTVNAEAVSLFVCSVRAEIDRGMSEVSPKHNFGWFKNMFDKVANKYVAILRDTYKGEMENEAVSWLLNMHFGHSLIMNGITAGVIDAIAWAPSVTTTGGNC